VGKRRSKPKIRPPRLRTIDRASLFEDFSDAIEHIAARRGAGVTMLAFPALLAALGVGKEAAGLLDKAADQLFGASGKKLLEEVQGRLRAFTGKVPANHDLEKAIRLAELTATLVLVDNFRRKQELDNFDTRSARFPPFIDAANAWLFGQIGLCPELKVVSNDELVAELNSKLDAILPETRAEEVKRGLTQAQLQVWDALIAGAGQDAPAEFKTLFFGEEDGEPGWSVLFLAFMREALKKNPHAEIAYVTTRLATVRDSLLRAEDQLASVKEDTTAIRSQQQLDSAKISEVLAKNDEILRAINQKSGVPLDTLRAILSEMGDIAENADAEEIVQKLSAKAEEYKALTDRLNRLSNADPDVARLRKEAAEALKSGRFAQADALLAAAEVRDLAGLGDLEALAKQRRLSAAETRAERAAAAMLRGNPDAYREAAAHYAEASRIAAAADVKIARHYAHQQGATLGRLGDEFGNNAVLLEGIEHFRGMLASASRMEDPADWATTQNNLGNAIATLGARESGSDRLDEAVGAFRAALKEWTRERVPLDRAATQVNLGNALATLGGRESGTQKLDEAVAAYREALKEYTRERVPLDWARTQMNLGSALAMLGERESGTATLEEAVAAYRDALKESTRERVPLEWARTQMNLGNALQALGKRESGTQRLDEAVASYREALKERTRERVPLQWAMTQMSLGNALARLGERESGTERLDEAVAAYREALSEQTREHVPLDWAISIGNQGVAMSRIADRRKDIALAETALQQIEEAYEEVKKAGHAPHAAIFEAAAVKARAVVRSLRKK
jgi:tetratricopeptide (TPR) repeat protein